MLRAVFYGRLGILLGFGAMNYRLKIRHKAPQPNLLAVDKMWKRAGDIPALFHTDDRTGRTKP
jgi:uncharacterized membrane protein